MKFPESAATTTQGGPSGAVVRPCKCLWDHTPQASQRGTEPASFPRKFRELILNYYDSFSLKAFAGPPTSEWHKIEKGIITGCTISAILFALVMNMLVKSANVEVHGRGPLTKSFIKQLPIRVFTDDLTVTTTSGQGNRWICKGLEELITWARMSFKPAKC